MCSNNSTEIAGLLTGTEGRHEVVAEACGGNYRKLIFEQDRLVGLLFLGKAERAGVYANLIRCRIPLGGRKDAIAREVMAGMKL